MNNSTLFCFVHQRSVFWDRGNAEVNIGFGAGFLPSCDRLYRNADDWVISSLGWSPFHQLLPYLGRYFCQFPAGGVKCCRMFGPTAREE